MNTAQNGMFDKMVAEAMEEVAHQGWNKADQNAVTLAAFGIMCQRVESRMNGFMKPAWTIALSIVSAAIWFIISGMLGLQ